jgi:alkylation response protein AidB-like acyl-CoA dehydrogenase
MSASTVKPFEAPDAAAEFARVADQLFADRLTRGHNTSSGDLVEQHRQLWPELRDLGWFDVVVDPEDGGLGLPPSVLGEMFRSVGRRLAPGPFGADAFSVPCLLSTPQTARYCATNGSEEPASRWLIRWLEAGPKAERPSACRRDA